MSLPALYDLPNAFEAIKLVGLPDAPPSEQMTKLYIWDLFRRAADAQGLPKSAC
jgi:hypothetical protein